MASLAHYDLVIIVIALIVGLTVAFWAFRRRAGADAGAASVAPPRTEAPPRPARVEAQEGAGLPVEFAAAAKDVAGEILGVDAHPDFSAGAGAGGPPDNLQMLKGVGPKLAAQLNQYGITRFEQLARLGENEVAMLDERMGAFKGRIARDRLGEQACYLAEGDTDGFEAKFGRLGG
jgi:predicted flap endonuclease-1-like 5' DNA nuclease